MDIRETETETDKKSIVPVEEEEQEETNESMDNIQQEKEKKRKNRRGESIADLVNKNDSEKNHLKNLYQNIGTKVSKLREINDNHKSKILGQRQEMFIYNERIAEKLKLLEQIREAKRTNNKNFINEKYLEIFNKQSTNIAKTDINETLLNKDPLVKKMYYENEKEVDRLQENLNGLIKKNEDFSNQINKLRVENYNSKQNLADLLKIKEQRSKDMDIISKEANKYLEEKDNVNKNLLDLNHKIDEQKQIYEVEMQNINKMIDNTKKIKQFYENMAVEKFSKPLNKKSFFSNDSSGNFNSGSNNKITEEKIRLDELSKELEIKNKITIYLNFSRFILFKKQQQLQKIVEEVKQQTGIENLDSLSKYLEMSTRNNKLFETDIKNLSEQKESLEKKIVLVKQELQNSQCLLNDTSSKKFEYLEKIRNEIKIEEKIKNEMNKKLFTMNRIIDVLAIGLRKVCLSLKIFNLEMKFDAEVIFFN